jgi:potassium voltage-gated channel Shal-related subfamily D protein 2
VLGREFTIVWEILSKEGVCFLSLDHHYYAGSISRMIQDRYEDGNVLLTRPAIGRGSGTTTDLSNFKLAENQTELSKQISELRTTVEEQGIMLQRLLDAVEKGKQREEY